MAENNYANLSMDKFRFVQQNEKLHDKALKTKPIGYFKDACWFVSLISTLSSGTP